MIIPELKLPKKSASPLSSEDSPSESDSGGLEPKVEVGSLNQTVIKADLDSLSDSFYSGGMMMISQSCGGIPMRGSMGLTRPNGFM